MLGTIDRVARPSNYSPELRAQALQMVAELTLDYPSRCALTIAVAMKQGVATAETLGKRLRRAEVDAGQRPGTPSAERAECRVSTALPFQSNLRPSQMNYKPSPRTS